VSGDVKNQERTIKPGLSKFSNEDNSHYITVHHLIFMFCSNVYVEQNAPVVVYIGLRKSSVYTVVRSMRLEPHASYRRSENDERRLYSQALHLAVTFPCHIFVFIHWVTLSTKTNGSVEHRQLFPTVVTRPFLVVVAVGKGKGGNK